MRRRVALIALACAACEPPGIRPAMPRGAVEVDVGVSSQARPDHAPLVRASVWAVPSAGAIAIDGTLHDEQRRGVSNAAIVLVPAGHVALDVVLTDEAGAFHFALDRAGTYTITMYYVDFTADLSPIAIAARTTTRVDITADLSGLAR